VDQVKDGQFPQADTLQLLIEAAYIDQQTISAAARRLCEIEGRLDQQVRALSDWVAGEVDRRLATTIDTTASRIAAALTAANDAAEQARTHYEHAAQLAISRIQFLALGCFGLGSLGMILGVYVSARVILPPPDIFERQRQAEATVAELAAHGGNSILKYCDTGPCCMDQPVDAVIPCFRCLMRCGRSWGVPAPAYGSGRRQQLPLRPPDARWFASAAHDR